jgi:hypothetical protein
MLTSPDLHDFEANLRLILGVGYPGPTQGTAHKFSTVLSEPMHRQPSIPENFLAPYPPESKPLPSGHVPLWPHLNAMQADFNISLSKIQLRRDGLQQETISVCAPDDCG